MRKKELHRKRKSIKKSDEIDLANDEMHNRITESIKSIRITKPPVNHSNKCLWCQHDIDIKDGRRWCSPDCRDAHTATYKL